MKDVFAPIHYLDFKIFESNFETVQKYQDYKLMDHVQFTCSDSFTMDNFILAFRKKLYSKGYIPGCMPHPCASYFYSKDRALAILLTMYCDCNNIQIEHVEENEFYEFLEKF